MCLLSYPSQAYFGRIIAKSKIYEHSGLKSSGQVRFSRFIHQVKWLYKLSPETVNLSSTVSVGEIQVLRVVVKEVSVPDDILRLIDESIPSAIIFELLYRDRIMVKAAYKRRIGGRVLLSRYFASEWFSVDSDRVSLPGAIDLGVLYDALLSCLMPRFEGGSGVSLEDRVSRYEALKAKEAEVAKIERKLKRVKQFNRKVELNRRLKDARREFLDLKDCFRV